jgi:23S rRNA-/tRNA-specific pseudouridylate synthase
LVHGLFGVLKERIFLPLGRKAGERQVFTVRPDGREAVTDYQVEKMYQQFDGAKLWGQQGEKLRALGWRRQQVERLYQGFSLVQCVPKTGRTHQIRVHLSYLKHPLVGEKLYSSAAKIKWDALWCKRQFLHASSLQVVHPREGREMTISSPLSEDLERALGFLG